MLESHKKYEDCQEFERANNQQLKVCGGPHMGPLETPNDKRINNTKRADFCNDAENDGAI